jgi:hypothetical protein
MIVLQNLVRAATQTPINVNRQTVHGDLLIKADKSQVHIVWQLPEENPVHRHDISTQNPSLENWISMTKKKIPTTHTMTAISPWRSSRASLMK